MSLSASKADIAHQLFVRTADENYVTARWCSINGLRTDFLWLAVHSLEKYLKAVLLLNGHSTKNYGHDVVRLYEKVSTFAHDLLPINLSKPPTLEISHWKDRTPIQFMKHLLDSGNADNRYLIYGYATRSQDLHMLDQMVFATRRLVCFLETRVFPNDPKHTETFREVLLAQPDFYFPHYLPLDDLIAGKAVGALRHAALNLNMSFAPKGYPHEPIQGGFAAVNPVIVRRILDPLESDKREDAEFGVELARWFLAKVQVPKGKPGDPGVVEQIEDAIKAAVAKHGLS